MKFVLRVMAMLTFNSDVYDKNEGWDERYDDPMSLSELRESAWQTAAYAKDQLELMEKALGLEKNASV